MNEYDSKSRYWKDPNDEGFLLILMIFIYIFAGAALLFALLDTLLPSTLEDGEWQYMGIPLLIAMGIGLFRYLLIRFLDIVSYLKVISENSEKLRKLETINRNLCGTEQTNDAKLIKDKTWADFSYLGSINRRLESIEKKLED